LTEGTVIADRVGETPCVFLAGLHRAERSIAERIKLPRRKFLHLAATAVALPAVSRIARAQAYPTRPVRIVVGFAPGGGVDIIARLMGQWLSERLGQPFVIENRPGAGTNIATEAVVRAPADGYTLLLAFSSNAINATLYNRLNFNFIRDITPAAGIMRASNVVLMHPSVSAKTVPEFIELAKASPGELSMASGGNGSTAHLAGELFKMMTGVNLVHVPYRSTAPALTDLLGGQVQVSFSPLTGTIEYIRSGKLRALAVTTKQRSEALPDIPSVDDFVPGYEASAWYGLATPKNTPLEMVDKLNSHINAALADRTIKTRLADLGGTPLAGPPADFAKLIAEETEKWGTVIKFAGIKSE
jgi:tripartite-type tricarboxylate transporter receptor subunit TctC